MSLIKDSLTTLSTKIIQLCCTIFLSITIARVLGPTGKGEWTMILLIPTMIVFIFNFGIDTANVYFLGKRKIPDQQVISNSILLAALIGLFTIVVFILLIDFIKHRFLGNFQTKNSYLISIVSLVPLLLTIKFLSSYLQGKRKIFQMNLISAVEFLCFSIGVALSLLVFDIGLNGIIFSYISSIIISLILVVRFLPKESSLKFVPNAAAIKNTIRYGIIGYFANLLQFLNYRLDMFLVNFYMSLSSVGIYSIAVNLTEMMWYMTSSISLALYPKISQSEKAENLKLVPLICRVNFWFTIILSLIFFATSKIIVDVLYGKQFLAASRCMMILIPGICIFSITKVLANYFLGTGRPGINSTISLLALTINIALNIFLIPRYGIEGAAIATTISYTFSSLFTIIIFLRMTDLTIQDLFLLNMNDLFLLKHKLFSFLNIKYS